MATIKELVALSSIGDEIRGLSLNYRREITKRGHLDFFALARWNKEKIPRANGYHGNGPEERGRDSEALDDGNDYHMHSLVSHSAQL